MQAWEAAGSVGVRGRGVFLDNQHSELCLLVEVPQGLEQGEGGWNWVLIPGRFVPLQLKNKCLPCAGSDGRWEDRECMEEPGQSLSPFFLTWGH